MRNSCLTGNFLIPEVPLNAYNFHFYSNHWCMLIVDQLSWWYKNMFAPESQIFRCLMAKVQIQFCWRQLRKCPMMPPPPRPHLQLQLLHHPPPHPRRRQPTPPCTQGRLPSCAWDRWCNWMISRHISTGQFILGKLHLASHLSAQSTWAAWSLVALQPGSTNFRQNSVNWDIWQGDPQTTHKLLTRVRGEPALQARRARDRWGRRPSGCPPPQAAGAPGASFSSGPAKSQDNLTFNIWKGDQGMYFGTLTSSEDIGLTDIPPSSSWKLTLRFTNIE